MGKRWPSGCGKAVFVRCAMRGGDVIVLWLGHRTALLCLQEGGVLIRCEMPALVTIL